MSTGIGALGESGYQVGMASRVAVTVSSLSKPVPAHTTSGQAQGDSVTLSGVSLVAQRLFHTTADQLPTPLTSVQPGGGSVYSFLTQGDRDFLAQAYDYAQAQGWDLTDVDQVAGQLGQFRMLQASNGGATPQGHTSGDYVGQTVVKQWGDADSATITRIAASNAYGSSSIPKDFLSAIMNPAYYGSGVAGNITEGDKTALSNSGVNWDAIEQLVYGTAKGGYDASTNADAAKPILSVAVTATGRAPTADELDEMREMETLAAAHGGSYLIPDLDAWRAAREGGAQEQSDLFSRVLPSVADPNKQYLLATLLGVQKEKGAGSVDFTNVLRAAWKRAGLSYPS